MTNPPDPNSVPAAQTRTDSIRASTVGRGAQWPWLLGLGILLDALGMIVMGSAFYVSMRILGWLLILGGIIRAFQAARVARPNSAFIELVTAVLYVLVGIWLVFKPASATPSATNALVISVLLILDGILHIAGSVMTRYPNWKWPLVYSILVLLFGLGLAIWQQFSHLRIWAIAWILGITMMLNGCSLVVMGWTDKTRPSDAA